MPWRGNVLNNQQKYIELFQTSQCSWCRKFYTNEPFLCPYKTLQSSCPTFERLIEIPGWYSRENEIEKYKQRIIDMMQHVEEKEIMARCRVKNCGALNPNPQKPTCWKWEKHYLTCPEHPDLILRYNIKEDFWKCPLVSHPKKYHEIHEKIEPTPTDIPCPKCSKKQGKICLYYDTESLLLKCNECGRVFTYVKGKLKAVKYKK